MTPTEPLSEGECEALGKLLTDEHNLPWYGEDECIRDALGAIVAEASESAALIVAAVNALPALLHDRKVLEARLAVAEAELEWSRMVCAVPPEMVQRLSDARARLAGLTVDGVKP